MFLSAAVCLFVFLGAAVAYDYDARLGASDDDVEAKPGKPATLICPIVSDRWYGPSGKTVELDTWHLGGKNFLNITSVGANDVGVYACGVDSENRTVKLFSSPHAKSSAKSKNYVVGESAAVTCVAWGYTERFPVPKIRWQKTKDNVTTDVPVGNNETDAYVEHVPHKDPHLVEETLVLKNLSYEEYAVYQCFAYNDLGNSTGATLVRVKNNLAPLWPFIGIIIEVFILIVIIVIYEKRKAKQSEEDEKTDNQTNATNDHKGGEEGVRQRK